MPPPAPLPVSPALIGLVLLLFSSSLGAATVQIIVPAIGGGSPGDPLAAGVGKLGDAAISPTTGELHWSTGKQVVRRRSDGVRKVVVGLDAFGDAPDGALATASTFRPDGIAFDATGNLYFAGNARVRKLNSATGTVTTVAGTGTSGDSGDGGAATSAQLGLSLCLTVDAAGNLFISDSTYGRVRCVAAGTGIISTWAGIGFNVGFGGDGILGDTAGLGYPKGIACDAAGNLFIADSDHNRVRRVDAVTRIISTVAGNGDNYPYNEGGQATSAGLLTPMDVEVTAAGDLYISAQGYHRIRKVTASDGKITTVCGTTVSGFLGDNGPALSARLYNPGALARDADGNLFICDVGNFRIREVVASTQDIVTVVGNGSDNFSGDGGQALAATVAAPCVVIFDASDNRYVVDQDNNRIRKVVKSTGVITTIAGNGEFGFSGDGFQATDAKLAKPSCIAFDFDGNLLIADQYNHRIRKVTLSTGVITTIAGTGPANEAYYGTHEGDGGLAINAHLCQPEYLAVAPNGDIYCSDMQNQRIAKIAKATGIITTFAGDGANRTTLYSRGVGGFSGDGGQATSALFDLPTCLRLDAVGNLYVADCANCRIRQIATDGVVTTIAGSATNAYVGDGGVATAAGLGYPTSMVFNASGDLFIADQSHQCIRRIDHVTQIITTIAGTGVAGYSGDGGPAVEARMYSPTGVSFGNDGHLFITQRYVNVIHELLTVTVPTATWAPQTLTYGTGLSSAQFNATSPVSGTFSYAQASGAVLAVGTPAMQATFIPSDLRAYSTLALSANVTVTRAPLAVVADGKAKTMGAANPPLTYHLDGLVNGDTVAVLSGSPVLATAATTGSAVGSYAITVDVSSVTTANYTVSGSAGTLTVSAASGSTPVASGAGGGGCGLGSGMAVLVLTLMSMVMLMLARMTTTGGLPRDGR